MLNCISLLKMEILEGWDSKRKPTNSLRKCSCIQIGFSQQKNNRSCCIILNILGMSCEEELSVFKIIWMPPIMNVGKCKRQLEFSSRFFCVCLFVCAFPCLV